MRLVLAEMRLVQVAEMRLVPWVPPAFLEGGGGQNRAKGRHLTGTNMLSTFSGFNQRGGVLSAFGQFNQRGGEGGGAVRFLTGSTSGGRGGEALSTFG